MSRVSPDAPIAICRWFESSRRNRRPNRQLRLWSSSKRLTRRCFRSRLIATGRYAEARALTEQVLKEFVVAGLNDSAITALAYLRDLLPTTREARRAVQHVRSHLEQLRSEPARVFLPLDES